MQSHLLLARCLTGTAVGTGPSSLLAALERAIRVTGSRALAIIWSPEETQLPFSGQRAPPASLPDAVAGTLLRGHYGWDVARNHRTCQSRRASVLPLWETLRGGAGAPTQASASPQGRMETRGEGVSRRQLPSLAMNRPKVCCLVSITLLLKRACDKGYIDVLHGMRRAAHMCRGSPFGEAAGSGSTDLATEQQHSPWNRPGGCGWPERAQTRVYEVMEDLLVWLSWGGGPGGGGAELVAGRELGCLVEVGRCSCPLLDTPLCWGPHSQEAPQASSRPHPRSLYF